ncbi:exodeoxyribonuclease V subunit gamma [Streptomyces sp. N2-109]|uniref:DNA 3'-5' helicase n=1 Tax=Streptomyces gossypii TaxID=2883101 RepID=A0ABT2JSL0_9ACTN|nr:UvrD-helicase domain-containing protein [Streptomyces gossypii]MCT2590871.1 exodeoxyribonuclease V subunit gamma [Streptomyces gossypii]
MPHLAFDIGFCTELHKLQADVKKGVFDAWQRFQVRTLTQLLADPGLHIEKLRNARDPHIRTIRITGFWRGVVLAPESGDTFVLLKVLPHDKAIAWGVKQRSSINTVTRAVELRDAATLDQLTPPHEEKTEAPSESRLLAHVSDGELASLGIDADTIRRARTLTDKEQLEAFAPFFPPDQCEVLQYLAERISVEEVWRELVAHRVPAGGTGAVDETDYDTAIRHTVSRILLVTASEELHDILDKPFSAWRIFLHPSQRRIAYRPSYSGPAQVSGGPGTGKTVVALHRVKHLLAHLRDDERILLTTYTNALVTSLRSGLTALVDDEQLRDRVDVMTVDAFASRVLTTAPGQPHRRAIGGAEEERRWTRAAEAVQYPGSAQFLAQEYKHVVLAQDLRSREAYEAADRAGRGSRLTPALKPHTWRAFEAFTSGLEADELRTYLQTSAEAARVLTDNDTGTGPPYRHVVIDEAQDLHPAQWRLLRAAVPARPDDLFIAGDPHQRIYDSKVSLKALGIKVVGRSTRMRKNYRSTQEILAWSTALLLGRPIDELADTATAESLLGYRSALRGTGPALHAATDEATELDALADRCREWIDSGVNPSDIGIATRFKKTGDAALARLTAAEIPARRLRARASDPDDAVSIGTMHAFKGLEFRCVAVIGVHDGALPFPRAITPEDLDRLQHEADLLAERCLLFVACTRARDGLYVSWSGEPSSFLTEAGVRVSPA